MWVLWLLWSINERLGNQPGRDFEEPSQDWIEDLQVLRRREREADLLQKGFDVEGDD